jgi:hypothetical protein
VSGKAGMFSILPFMLTIGAGIGLLSLSELIADMFLLNCTDKKKYYKKIKQLKAKDTIEHS